LNKEALQVLRRLQSIHTEAVLQCERVRVAQRMDSVCNALRQQHWFDGKVFIFMRKHAVASACAAVCAAACVANDTR
jgi:hypothetical protein